MLWKLVESSEIVLFCVVFYGRPSRWSDTVCDSVKDNSDLFVSIFIAATATNSLIVKEELRIYCEQTERQTNERRKYMINRL